MQTVLDLRQKTVERQERYVNGVLKVKEDAINEGGKNWQSFQDRMIVAPICLGINLELCFPSMGIHSPQYFFRASNSWRWLGNTHTLLSIRLSSLRWFLFAVAEDLVERRGIMRTKVAEVKETKTRKWNQKFSWRTVDGVKRAFARFRSVVLFSRRILNNWNNAGV